MIQPLDFETRIVLPFLFQYTRGAELLNHLLAIRLQDQPVWHRQPLDGRYTDNVLPFLSLFSEAGDPATAGVYLRADQPLEANLFPQSPGDDSTVAVQLVPRNGLELFLRPYGTGVLSIALTSRQPLQLSEIREFNRRLHFGHTWMTQNPARLPRLQVHLPDRPMTEEFLPRILQILSGGAFPGGEHQSRFQTLSVQRSMNVYTVVRLPPEVDFHSATTREQWASELAALRGIWPAEHCGTTLESLTGQSAPLLLNRRHWMAVGHHGAAHLVSDQPESDGPNAVAHNERRMPLASDKMFLQYLVPLFQRLTMQTFSREAAAAAADSVGAPLQTYQRLQPLRQTLTHYALQGYAFQLSDEDNASRVYRKCQRALGVEESMTRLEAVLSDMDSQLRSGQQIELSHQMAEGVREQTALQEKVEWLEVFIVTVYAVKLAHYLGDAFSPHDTVAHTLWYPGLTLGVVLVITMIAMFSALRMWPAKQAAESGAVDASQTAGLRTRFSAAVAASIDVLATIGNRCVAGKRRWAILWILAAVGLHVVSGMVMVRGHGEGHNEQGHHLAQPEAAAPLLPPPAVDAPAQPSPAPVISPQESRPDLAPVQTPTSA